MNTLNKARVLNILIALEQEGWLIYAVNDGEEKIKIDNDDMLKRIKIAFDVIDSVDESTVYVKKETEKAWVYLIIDNGEDMLSDYSANIDNVFLNYK